jgi:CheY-like chemotaxis protein
MDQHIGRKLNILVADDEPLLRRVIYEFLTEEGHDVDEAADGISAWELLTGQCYDYAILDFQMPGMNGLEVLSLMHHLSCRPRSILITGSKTESVEDMALGYGAAGCYEKPLQLNRLLADLVWAPRVSDVEIPSVILNETV